VVKLVILVILVEQAQQGGLVRLVIEDRLVREGLVEVPRVTLVEQGLQDGLGRREYLVVQRALLEQLAVED
jgi:hypothetical protein